MTDIHSQIETTLKHYQDCWQVLDFDGIRSHWDTDLRCPVYLAEELRDVCTSWKEIEAYWQTTASRMQKIRTVFSELQTIPLNDDLVSAVYRLKWNARLEGYENAIAGWTRVSALFRKKTERWVFIQMIEAPLAPIVYMQERYEEYVDADF